MDLEGGGRIALYYTSNSGFNDNANITAYGGGSSQSGYYGAAGTIFISDTDTPGNNTLRINNNNHSGPETWGGNSTPAETVVVNTLQLQPYAKFVLKSAVILDLSSITSLSANGASGVYLHNEAGGVIVNPNLTIGSLNFITNRNASFRSSNTSNTHTVHDVYKSG